MIHVVRMRVSQWGVRVPARQGEEVRQALIREGALDTSLKVLRDGESLILPLLDRREGAEWCEFEAHPAGNLFPATNWWAGSRSCRKRTPRSGETARIAPFAPHGSLCQR